MAEVIAVILNLVVGVHISGLVDLGNHCLVLAKQEWCCNRSSEWGLLGEEGVRS